MAFEFGECRRGAFGSMRHHNFDGFRRGNSWSCRGRGGFGGRGRFDDFPGPFGHHRRGSFGAERGGFGMRGRMHGFGPFEHHRHGFGPFEHHRHGAGPFEHHRRGSFSARDRSAHHSCFNHCLEHCGQMENQHPFHREHHCQCLNRGQEHENRGCTACQHVCGHAKPDQDKDGECQVVED